MDRVVRGILNEGKVRIFFADIKESCKEICGLHGCTPVVSDALSRVLSVGAIMGDMQKDGKLTIKIDSCGPVKLLLVDADSTGKIRGFVANPEADVPLKPNGRLDVGSCVGELGVITVIKDLGMKQQFSSQIELQSGEIGDDFSMYFRESEQVPSVVAVGSVIDTEGKVSQAGAIIIQLMPGYEEIDIQYVETLARNLPSMSEILSVDAPIEDKLKELMPEIEILGSKEVYFQCGCSMNKIIASLTTLNSEELEEMIEEEKDYEIRCEFCARTYKITKQDLEYALSLRRKYREVN